LTQNRPWAIVEDVEPPRPDNKPRNGTDPHVIEDPIDNAELLARIEVCIAKCDDSRKMSDYAGTAIDAMQLDMAIHKRMLQRLTTLALEQRTGIPSSWPRRLVLVAAAAILGGLAGAGSAFAMGVLR